MKIPKYVSELLCGAEYVYKFSDYIYNDEDGNLEYKDMFAAGYTIAIRKGNICGGIEPFRKEIERLAAWVNRQNGGVCVIHYIPLKARRKHKQYAIITLFDPIMRYIELNGIKFK